MRRASLFPGLLLLGLTIGSPVWASHPPAGNAIEAEAILEAREAAVSQREAELVRREATRELRAEIEDAANGRLEIIGGWLGALIGLFGIAVTIATLIVTFRTPAVAAQAARETAHKAVAEEKARIEALVEQIIAIGERAKTTDAELRAILDRHKAGQPVEQPGERATIEAAADAARLKAAGERTIDDLRSLILASRNAGDWEAMRDHARALLYLHGEDHDAKRVAYFNLAFAMDRLKRYQDALTALDQLIATYPNGAQDDDRRLLASGMFNRGLALEQLGKYEDSIAAYDELIRGFADSGPSVPSQPIAKAMVNKGYRLSNLDRPEAAIATYEEVIRRFGDSDKLALRTQVAMAMYNMGADFKNAGKLSEAISTYDQMIARFEGSDAPELRAKVTKAMIYIANIHARQKDAGATVAALRRWNAYVGKFDCEKIAPGTDFDTVRDDPQFVALVAEMGCQPTKKPQRRRKPA